MEDSRIATNLKEHGFTDNSAESGPPHEAMYLVLAYLPLFELLAMSQICRSLRDAVKKDILPWLNVIVDRPLNSRLTDETLMRITSKANGRLRTLVLINCEKVSDNGLQSVVAKNPDIQKLYVPACTGLTPGGIILAVETLTKHNFNFMSLMIRGIYNIQKEHLETLKSLIGLNLTLQNQQQRRDLYHEYKNVFAWRYEETGRSIDIDVCPKCKEARMVFDCPRETCKRKRRQQLTKCRGCYHCIPRCEECGICVESGEEEWTACPDILCSDCWLQLPKCNFCNKPYCNQHADQKCSVPGSSGFACQACEAKFIKNIHH